MAYMEHSNLMRASVEICCIPLACGPFLVYWHTWPTCEEQYRWDVPGRDTQVSSEGTLSDVTLWNGWVSLLHWKDQVLNVTCQLWGCAWSARPPSDVTLERYFCSSEAVCTKKEIKIVDFYLFVNQIFTNVYFVVLSYCSDTSPFSCHYFLLD